MWMRPVELHPYLAIDLSAAFEDVEEAEARCRKAAGWMMRFVTESWPSASSSSDCRSTATTRGAKSRIS